MLDACNGHRYFCPQCVVYATMIMNTMLSRHVKKLNRTMVPMEVLSGTIVSTELFAPFGCDATIFIPIEKRNAMQKFESRGVDAVFLGLKNYGNRMAHFYVPLTEKKSGLVIAKRYKRYRFDFRLMTTLNTGQ